jgi:hypothetical protein
MTSELGEACINFVYGHILRPHILLRIKFELEFMKFLNTTNLIIWEGHSENFLK